MFLYAEKDFFLFYEKLIFQIFSTFSNLRKVQLDLFLVFSIFLFRKDSIFALTKILYSCKHEKTFFSDFFHRKDGIFNVMTLERAIFREK